MSHTTTAPGPTPALTTVERYVRFWNAASPQEQQELAEEVFADGVTYHAVIGVLSGAAELIDFRDRFAQHSPGGELRALDRPDAHHDSARLRWELVVDGGSFAAGTDVLQLDDTGRVARVTTFLDRAPEGFDPHGDH